MKSRNGFTPLGMQMCCCMSKNLKTSLLGCNCINGYTRPDRKSGLSLTGFTLIELMIVVVILAVLAAAVVPRLAGRTQQARIATAKMDISGNINVALDLYELDNGRYPSTEQGLASLITKPSSSPAPANWNGPYLKKKPADPWGNEYKYVSPGAHSNDYDLYSAGPDGAEGGADDITNWEIEKTESAK